MINKKEFRNLQFELINLKNKKIKDLFEELSQNILSKDFISCKISLNKLIKEINEQNK